MPLEYTTTYISPKSWGFFYTVYLNNFVALKQNKKYNKWILTTFIWLIL